MKRLVCIVMLAAACGCSPKIIEKVVTEIEYRDRYVHDTTEVKIALADGAKLKKLSASPACCINALPLLSRRW